MVRPVIQVVPIVLCLAFGLVSGALADSKLPQSPTSSMTVKTVEPPVLKDLYCTNGGDSKSKLPACDQKFKTKCDEHGGTMQNPSGNPDVGICVHDDVW